MNAITQAQLVFAYGDKHVCRNVHFLSRLNLGIFWCAKRTFYHHCYFEMTDDSMGDTGVYLECKMKFSVPCHGVARNVLVEWYCSIAICRLYAKNNNLSLKPIVDQHLSSTYVTIVPTRPTWDGFPNATLTYASIKAILP